MTILKLRRITEALRAANCGSSTKCGVSWDHISDVRISEWRAMEPYQGGVVPVPGRWTSCNPYRTGTPLRYSEGTTDHTVIHYALTRYLPFAIDEVPA